MIRNSAVACFFALSALHAVAHAQPAEKWHVDRAVTVSPAPAPRPAMLFRLFPSTFDLKEGNAVPIYLRFVQERNDAWKKDLRDKPAKWNKLPLEKLPLADAMKFLASHRYDLKQLELGARRTSADWHYTLDAGNPIQLLLGDVQETRAQAPLAPVRVQAQVLYPACARRR